MAEKRREYPKFPIPAVGAIVLHEDQVLLIQRGREPAKGKWTLPGGAIEVGESPEEALVREVREECSLDIQIQDLVAIVNKIIRDDNEHIQYQYLILDYLAFCQNNEGSDSLRLQAGSDVMNAHWIPIREFASYDLTEGLADIIHQAIEMREQIQQK